MSEAMDSIDVTKKGAALAAAEAGRFDALPIYKPEIECASREDIRALQLLFGGTQQQRYPILPPQLAAQLLSAVGQIQQHVAVSQRQLRHGPHQFPRELGTSHRHLGIARGKRPGLHHRPGPVRCQRTAQRHRGHCPDTLPLQQFLIYKVLRQHRPGNAQLAKPLSRRAYPAAQHRLRCLGPPGDLRAGKAHVENAPLSYPQAPSPFLR